MIFLYTFFLCTAFCSSFVIGMDNKSLTSSKALTTQELHEEENLLFQEKQKKIENLQKNAFVISLNRDKKIESIPLETAQKRYPSMAHLFKHQQVVSIVHVIIEHPSDKEFKKYFSVPHEFFLENDWKITEYTDKQGNRIEVGNLGVANNKSELRMAIAREIEHQRMLKEIEYNLKINTTQADLDRYKKTYENLNEVYNTVNSRVKCNTL